MKKAASKRVLLIAAAALVLALAISAFLPDPLPVQTAVAARGPMQVIVEEEGVTRVVDRYDVTAPVSATLRRIDLQVGDAVSEGQVLARLEPPRAALLDPRSQAEAEARVAAARASLEQARAAAQSSRAELARIERLYAAEAATLQRLEQVRADAAQAEAAMAAAQAELEAAVAAQGAPSTAPAAQVEDVVRAPAAGRVLAIHRRSAGQVMAGEPLLEIGDTGVLQVEAQVLSQDAVRMREGARVLVEQWGGAGSLEARISHISPQGVTEVSALGVKEQRVQVIADLVSPAEAYRGLGPGYRVLARFLIWEAPDVLQVPTAAIFRLEDGEDEWALFTVKQGRAALARVAIGHQADLSTEILEGLTAGQVVIVHPGNEVEDGSRVRPNGR